MTHAELQIAFDQHREAVFRFAWRMTNSAAVAEDIAQDVFLSLLRQPARFDPARGPLRPYLLGVARHLVLKRWRDDDRWTALDDERFVAQPLDVSASRPPPSSARPSARCHPSSVRR